VYGRVVANACVSQKTTDRPPTPFTENGKSVTLVIYKPVQRSFPALMFNHGSTGATANLRCSLLQYVEQRPGPIFFTGKGWLVAFPQRGRGKSDWLYGTRVF
jgi:hypothetical protein